MDRPQARLAMIRSSLSGSRRRRSSFKDPTAIMLDTTMSPMMANATSSSIRVNARRFMEGWGGKE